MDRAWRVARVVVLVAVTLWGGRHEDDTATVAGTRVVDGDTMVLADGRRLRLDSVDCPETGRPGADLATAFARRFLSRGPAVLWPEDPPRDRYGRLLGDLRVDGRSLSRALVVSGWAWSYRSRDEQLMAAQVLAVDERRGVHALLDGPAADGPYLLTTNSFHRGDCSVVRSRAAQLPLDWSAAGALRTGRAPCRRCLAWPPQAPFGLSPPLRLVIDAPETPGRVLRRAPGDR